MYVVQGLPQEGPTPIFIFTYRIRIFDSFLDYQPFTSLISTVRYGASLFNHRVMTADDFAASHIESYDGL